MPDLFSDLPRITDPHRSCPCGSNEFTLHKGVGPHASGLRCYNCERFWGWLSKEEYAALQPKPEKPDGDPPRPDLQKLVADHGGLYSQITPEAWAEWDRNVSEWETARRDRLLGSRTWANMPPRKTRK